VLAAAVAGWASAVPEAEVRVTLERSGYGAQGEFVLGSPRCFFMDPGQGCSSRSPCPDAHGLLGACSGPARGLLGTWLALRGLAGAQGPGWRSGP